MRRARYETDIESQQQAPVARPFHAGRGAVIQDIRQIARVREAPILDEPEFQPSFRHITRPGGVDAVDWSGEIENTNAPQLVMTRNLRRKGYLIINPDDAAETLYVSKGPTSTAWYALVPGAAWDESGSEIFIGDVFVKAATPGHQFGAQEMIPVDMRYDEYRR